MIVAFYKLEKHTERLNIIQMGSMLMQNEFSNTSSAQKLDGGKRKIKCIWKMQIYGAEKQYMYLALWGEVTLLALFVFMQQDCKVAITRLDWIQLPVFISFSFAYFLPSPRTQF